MKNLTVKALTAAVLLLSVTQVQAGPEGGSVVAGTATITTPSATQTTINQSTDKAIINWDSFNIGVDETTTFLQPSDVSVTLNRVTGNGDASQIMGSLESNGQIFLIDPNGILFGQNSRVDVGSIFATTSNISNQDFWSGNYRFSASSNPSASVVNLGTITAHDNGFVGLVASGVRNSGVISARFGRALLGAGNSYTIDLAGNGLIEFAVNDSIASQVIDVATGQSMTSLVQNNGTISASGGTIQLAAATAQTIVDSLISSTGVVEANSVGFENGKIVFSANTDNGLPQPQSVVLSGAINAQGDNSGETGGTVLVTGADITLSGAGIDASGSAGGGKVLIGGDYLGGGEKAAEKIEQYGFELEDYEIATATNVKVDEFTYVNVSALDDGNGGKAVFWSDGTMDIAAQTDAKGGTNGGDGGLVEHSAILSLIYVGARVNASAANGKAGTWLLDPSVVIINATEAANISTTLNTGTNVTVDATDRIQFSGETIEKTSGGDASLTLTTTGEIDYWGSDILSQNAGLSVNLIAEDLSITGPFGTFGGTPTTGIKVDGDVKIEAKPVLSGILDSQALSIRDSIISAGGDLDISVGEISAGGRTLLHVTNSDLSSGGDLTISSNRSAMSLDADSKISSEKSIAIEAVSTFTSDASVISSSADINAKSGIDITGDKVTLLTGSVVSDQGDISIESTSTKSSIYPWLWITGADVEAKQGDINLTSATEVYIGNSSGAIFSGGTAKAANGTVNVTAASLELLGSGNAIEAQNLVATAQSMSGSATASVTNNATLIGAGLGLRVNGTSAGTLTAKYDGGRVNGEHHGIIRESGFGAIKLELGDVDAKQIDARIESTDGTNKIGVVVKPDGWHFENTTFQRLADRTGIVNTKEVTAYKPVTLTGGGLFYGVDSQQQFVANTPNGRIDFALITGLNNGAVTPSGDLVQKSNGQVYLNGDLVKEVTNSQPILPESPSAMNEDVLQASLCAGFGTCWQNTSVEIGIFQEALVGQGLGNQVLVGNLDFSPTDRNDVASKKQEEIELLADRVKSYGNATLINLMSDEQKLGLQLALGLSGTDFESNFDAIETFLGMALEQVARIIGVDRTLLYVSDGIFLDRLQKAALRQGTRSNTPDWRTVLIDIATDVSREAWIDAIDARDDATTRATADLLTNVTKGMAKIYFGLDPIGGAKDIILAQGNAIMSVPSVARDGIDAGNDIIGVLTGRLEPTNLNAGWFDFDSLRFDRGRLLETFRAASDEQRQMLIDSVYVSFEDIGYRYSLLRDMRGIAQSEQFN